MQQQETIIERVRKLLALSTSSNPNEAASALAKANKLLLEYNLSMAQINASNPAADKHYIRNTVEIGKQVWRKTLLGIIAEHNLCKALVMSGTGRCWVIGQEHNIEVVVQMYIQIVKQLEYMAHTAYRLSGSTLNAISWKDAFYIGAVRTINERLEAERYAQNNQTRALVVRNEDEIKRAVARLFPNIRIKHAPRKTVRSVEGYREGLEAGKRVAFRKEIR